MRARRFAVCSVVAGVAFMLAAPPVSAAALPGGLGPCVPGNCPDPFPAVNNGSFAGRDNAVSIFVGTDFRVSGRAAEAEGRVVVGGDFSVNKVAGGSQVYNVGVVGVGSRVPPENGQDFLTTGGNVTVAPRQRLLADGGVVRHAGDLTGIVTGTAVRDPGAFKPYAALAGQLTTASECYARPQGATRPATGTVTSDAQRVRFTGDGKSKPQVFNVPAGTSLAGGKSYEFTGIPADATVLINVFGDRRELNTNSGDHGDTDPWNKLRNRMLWNFPDATSVLFAGGGNFQGSVLIANPASTTTVGLPSMNGRFLTTGALHHTSPTTGSEFHAYLFDGDLPSCSSPPTTTPITATTSTGKPTTTPVPWTPDSPSTIYPTPETSGGGLAGSGSDRQYGSLAATGVDVPVSVAIALVLITGGLTLRRAGRRR